MRAIRPMVGALAVACFALAGPTASAGTTGASEAQSSRAAPVTTLQLDFSDAAGATTALDSSGLGHHGAVGSHIRMRGSYATWDRHDPSDNPYFGADHLVMISDAADGTLDPGAGNFVVELRYRTTAKFGNIIQKGQATTAGGQVKWQQPKGVLGCMFKSPTGQAAVNSKTPLNDGQWHTVRCERTSTQVTMYVDGVYRNRIRKPTGTIDNRKPWTIGGKYECDTSDPTVGADSCDYFPGDIDYVTLTKG